MSKLTKFLSLGIDMMQALPEDDPQGASEFFKYRKYMNADKMERALKALKAYLDKQCVKAPENTERRAGSVEVTVTSEEKPLLCEVRFYGEEKDNLLTDEYTPVGRIDFVRKITGEDGKLLTGIPEGFWFVKISKGSEYVSEYRHIEVKAGETAEVKAELTRFVNLEKEGYFAGDIHHHSIYSSPVWGGTDDVIESAAEVADSMRALGLTYGALSDHHNILNHKDWKACEKPDFFPIPSKEISTSNGHVLSLGVDGFDVIYDIPLGEKRTEDRLRKEFVRITDEIREKGGLPQLNHPRDLQVSISWNRDFYDMTDIFETMEIWNGSNPMYFGSTNAKAAMFWRDLLEEGRYIPATSGSDTHNTRADDYHEMYGEAMRLFKELGRLSKDELAELSEFKKELESFRFIVGRFMPMLESWAKTTLTSGCVRTYVKLSKGERPNKDNVLSALRSGHSFLTTGPILTIDVDGVPMGETARLKNGTATVNIGLRSNRKLEKVMLYSAKGREYTVYLPEKESAPYYDYGTQLKDFVFEDEDYIFAVASGDVTNLAITNPVLIRKA